MGGLRDRGEVQHPTNRVKIPAEVGTYRIKAMDFSQQWSVNDVAVTVTENDILSIPSSVKATADSMVFQYDSAGASPSPSSATITAVPTNVTDTPFYEWFVEGASQGTSIDTAANFTYTAPAGYASMPQVVEVEVRNGSATGPIVARDELVMIGLKDATSLPAAEFSNGNHDILADSDGSNAVMTGSGGLVSAYFGTQELTYDGVGTSEGKFKVVGSVISGAAGIGGITLSGVKALVAAHGYLTSDSAVIRYTVTGVAGGVAFSRVVDQTLTKKKAAEQGIQGETGNTGNTGDTGPAGIDGMTPYIYPAAISLPASVDGVVSDYNTVGTYIGLKEGDDDLNFTSSTSSSALTNGSWQIYDTDVYPSGDITVGNISDTGNKAFVGNHSGMDQNTSVVRINYDIRYKRNDGSVDTLIISQMVSKSIAGIKGDTGNAGAGVLVVFADDDNISTNTQSLTPDPSRPYTAHYEYTGSAPSLPIRSGINFVKYLGEDGNPANSIHTIYAEDAAGTGQSFTKSASRPYVTFMKVSRRRPCRSLARHSSSLSVNRGRRVMSDLMAHRFW